MAVLLARAAGLRLAAGLRSAVLGLLPACGLVLVLTELRHIVYVQPPFPSTPDILWAVLMIALAGVVAMLCTTVWSRRPGMRVASTTSIGGPSGASGAGTDRANGTNGVNGANGADRANSGHGADGVNGANGADRANSGHGTDERRPRC